MHFVRVLLFGYKPVDKSDNPDSRKNEIIIATIPLFPGIVVEISEMACGIRSMNDT